VVFLALFVKWALQTNKKNVFEEPAVSALIASSQSLLGKPYYIIE
jgi:hypothetical protein